MNRNIDPAVCWMVGNIFKRNFYFLSNFLYRKCLLSNFTIPDKLESNKFRKFKRKVDVTTLQSRLLRMIRRLPSKFLDVVRTRGWVFARTWVPGSGSWWSEMCATLTLVNTSVRSTPVQSSATPSSSLLWVSSQSCHLAQSQDHRNLFEPQFSHDILMFIGTCFTSAIFHWAVTNNLCVLESILRNFDCHKV